MTPRNPWNRRRPTTVFWLTISILATFSILCLGIAHAAPETPQQDGRFLFSLGEAGFGYDSATPVIVAGHTVCELLDAGESVDQAVQTLMGSTSLTRPWALKFIAISVANFCGRHGDALRPHKGGDAVQRLGVIA